MAGECVPQGPDLKEMDEEELWELINDNRHRISLGVRPCMLIPYLRQARVLTEIDEDEILSCHNLTNRSMRTSYMLDLLRTQGRNGAEALLDSLMIHYPTLYTQITGHQPSTEPCRFSGLMKYSELTEYLVRAVTGMQKELQEARNEASRMTTRCSSLQAKLNQVMEQEEKSKCLYSDYEHMRTHLASAQRTLAKLKDEQCDLYVRYTAAIEEKSAVNIHCRDLTLQVYQLQTELQKAQTETDFQKRRSLRCASPLETKQLREEVSTLRRQLLEAETFTPALKDIMTQDLAEAVDGRKELAERLQSYREENETLLREKEELLDQKECLSLQVQQITLDCDMYKQKSTVMHSQLRELQAERDQAYLSRDEAQGQIARSLAEKDTLRSQLVECQDRAFTLQARAGHRGAPQRDSSGEMNPRWEIHGSSSEDSSPLPRSRLRRMEAINPASLNYSFSEVHEIHGSSSEDSSPLPRSRLRRMEAINPASLNSSFSECEDPMPSSIRSRNVEPPSADSLRRREGEMYKDSSLETAESDSLLDDFVFLPNGWQDKQSQRLASSSQNSTDGLCRASAPPFLMRSRPQAVRITGRLLTLSFQGDALLSQLAVLGGNKTGVFVHKVTEGTAAHATGVSPGAQIVEVKYEQDQQALRMVLEDSTLEEALWALNQVTGTCQLTLRPSQDVYDNLVQQLQVGESSSGDSFYIRVNMSLPSGPGDSLAVACNDILHVTDTQPAGTSATWCASHVHPCQLLDLESGTVPNYYRAQRLLIRAIEEMNFQTNTWQKHGVGREKLKKQKAVRIVSTGRQGRNPLWVSVEDSRTKTAETGDVCAARACLRLMPYTLVTPYYPPICRPVLVLPTILGRVLDKKLAEWQGFQLCEAEVLSSSEHAARLQRSEVLEECEQGGSYTLQSVERVMKKGTHCILPLGLDCVRRLHRAEIFPIIIFIGQSTRSSRKLKSKLQRKGHSEEQLLACSQSEEPLLDKLPCLYRSVAPESWSDFPTLLTSLRTVIWEEQRKIVWVEPDLW